MTSGSYLPTIPPAERARLPQAGAAVVAMNQALPGAGAGIVQFDKLPSPGASPRAAGRVIQMPLRKFE